MRGRLGHALAPNGFGLVESSFVAPELCSATLCWLPQ
jgi:hypothetical protein